MGLSIRNGDGGVLSSANLEIPNQVLRSMPAKLRTTLNEHHQTISFFDRGFVAVVRSSESGRTVCRNANA
ncbi:MAG: hypothetical protein A2Z37_12300 [Chloroflexi bacterium RBG_19FT_COMBO_62_14]|nr:MAG: hypothetical protein A2Z37_12300 [Chloroflexi bacterium RBG_19FT_COMBO_62_14]